MPPSENTAGVRGCWKRIFLWRVPPNWSGPQWREEIKAQVSAAAWQASREYDPAYGVPLEAFVRQRALAAALTRHRQEWRYARRCVLEDEADESIPASPVSFPEDRAVLQDALSHLSSPDQCLIQQLFWDGWTEAEVARSLGVSQQAVSKRKQATLHALQKWLNASEKIGEILSSRL
ncbi:MAG: sigma-70 family RNA polymerase sigma factor [Armatimonadetes bacterium]|nr:sigma-70 family RNA polymerase sigma factor [Armatimonadota bacterium]